MRAVQFLLGAVLGVYLTFAPTLESGFRLMQPEGGDVVLNNYFLEHTYRWAFDAEYRCSFWSPTFFYPTPLTFTYSETLIGLAPVYWLLRTVCTDSVACQVWMILMLVMNYGAMALVLRWFGVSVPLAIAGAYLFGFGIVRTDHLTHQQLFPNVFAPFAVWYAWRFLQEPTTYRWTMMLVLVGWQILAGLHLGWFLWFGVFLLYLCAMATSGTSRNLCWQWVKRHPVGALLPALGVAAILGLYAKNFYRGAPERRLYENAYHYAPTFDAWFVAPEQSLWEDHLTLRVDPFDEQRLFHGFTLYGILLLAGVHAWRHREQRRLIFLMVGTAFLLCLSITRLPGDWSLWYAVHHVVPGANAFRAIGRIVLAALIFASIGGLVGFQAWLDERISCPKRSILVAWIVLLLIVVEQSRMSRASFAKSEQCYGPAMELAELMHCADVAYVTYDGSMPDYRHHITAMWAGMYARVPVMNGFSGTQPRDYPAYKDQPTVTDLVRLLPNDWEGRFVVIEPSVTWKRTMYDVRSGADPQTRWRRLD